MEVNDEGISLETHDEIPPEEQDGWEKSIRRDPDAVEASGSTPPDPSPERVAEAPEPQEDSDPAQPAEGAENASEDDTEDGDEDAGA